MWSPPDRSDVQVMFMDTGIGRWSYKYRGRWYTCWSQPEALYGWVHHPDTGRHVAFA